VHTEHTEHDDLPVLDLRAVAALRSWKPKTVTNLLYLSKPGRQLARLGNPFPAPDGRIGRAPWWRADRINEIVSWKDPRPGRGAGGGRPRKTPDVH
jgi:hypothetical protein